MAHQPDDARRNEAVEQLGTDHVVARRADGLAHVVEQRRRPEGPVRRGAASELEGLERVEERVPFGVIARVLPDAVERSEQVVEVVMHHRKPEQGLRGLPARVVPT